VPAALPNSHITTNTNSSPLKTRATQLVRRAGEWKWLHAAAAAEPLQAHQGLRSTRQVRPARPLENINHFGFVLPTATTNSCASNYCNTGPIAPHRRLEWQILRRDVFAESAVALPISLLLQRHALFFNEAVDG
jgi:hypothetical protein